MILTSFKITFCELNSMQLLMLFHAFIPFYTEPQNVSDQYLFI